MKNILIVTALLALAACSGTRQAYQAAEGVEETAKVIAEHYYATVREANRLLDDGALSGSELRRSRDLVRKTRPLILSMAEAARAYEQTKNAETEQALEEAITRAAVALSELIDVIKNMTGARYEPLSDHNVLLAEARQ